MSPQPGKYDSDEYARFCRHFILRRYERVIEISPPLAGSVINPSWKIPQEVQHPAGQRDRHGGTSATERASGLGALPLVLARFPEARVLFAGQYQGVLGEETYANRLATYIRELGDHWTFLGMLPPVEWSAFFHAAEVTVLPSINSTESFGMVQVESMSCGTPVVASNLPGVRQPVRQTGMGLIVEPQDSRALARALIKVLEQPSAYGADLRKINQWFSPSQIAANYEVVFNRLLRAKSSAVTQL
jgi:glycogen synthase